MSVELGTAEWLAAFCDAVNESEVYRRAAAGWRWPLALCFTAEAQAPTRHVWLDLHEGVCRGGSVVDLDRYLTAPFRIEAPYSRWGQVIHGALEPIKGLVLRRLRLEGDLLTVFRYMPAAKALLECASAIDTEVPAS